ncbi:hypothetical protein K493DRAFT_313989 [Basidiobolus meristosporus CBS 931.73]|uniref:Mitochondrial import receptor subunit tom40 n=1 Tax=Basidiobolus meristosporus CBS 931.73 TaxID=1314790 RepID=A0A1Y1YJ74_9FUNG|nr:hypothetical protein K493DRAFT_313989 [Basidiobolus meristosporus CBS 931.73]|eukprot:ORX97654.1 hypothetical protein K493DRAFT_313989 [Basidiobolus meristosporus CBS 931.73]
MSNSGLAPIWNPLYFVQRFNEYKASLGLPNPGPYEAIQREVKNTFLTNHVFDGARADLTKVLSQNFQVTHSFSLGSMVMPPTYSFGTVFVGAKSFLQGTIDTDGSLQARLNYAWSPNLVSKVQSQLSNQPGHSMLQLETDYNGDDFNLNVKAVNPSPAEGTGIFVGSYLQSVTKNLSVGLEGLLQKPTPDIEESGLAYVARYAKDNYIATAQFQGMGVIQASYYQKINEKVDFGTEVQILCAQGRREAVCSVGGKFDFRQATFRGQVDTTGKVSAVLEEKMAPGFSFLISGEIDHMKGASRFGVGIMLEA